MKFTEFLSEAENKEASQELSAKQKRAVKFYSTVDLTDSKNDNKVVEFLNKNIKVGTKEYLLNSTQGCKYLEGILNALIELVPSSSERSYSIGGNFRQISKGGIKIVVNEVHRGGYYGVNTRLAFALQVGSSYPSAIKFAIIEFMKGVFENLKQIGKDVEGRIFDSYGSAYSTIGIAYKESSYYTNPHYNDIEIKSNHLPL